MSEFWVSRKKYWCIYCETFITDDKPSRSQHEGGLRHQGNKERYVRNIYKTGEKRKRDLEEEKREMELVEKAANAAYAGDIAAGRGGSAHTALAASSSSQSASRPAPKPARPTSKFANYSTAESLGYKDEEAEQAALIADQRSKEGTVGAWEVVVPPPPPLPLPEEEVKPTLQGEEAVVDVKPLAQERAAPEYEDPDDTRLFRVRAKKVDLGDLYDPGEIKIKKKEPPKKDLGDRIIVAEGGGKKWKGGWETVDEANPSILLPQVLPVEAEEQDADAVEKDLPLERDLAQEQEAESKGEIKAEEGQVDAPPPSLGGSLFKKRKKPATAVDRRGARGDRF